MQDGGVQLLCSSALNKWRNTSAPFNGDEVFLELLSYPNTGDNRLVVAKGLTGTEDAGGGVANPRVFAHRLS